MSKSKSEMLQILSLIASLVLFIVLGEYALSSSISGLDLFVFRSINALSGNASLDAFFIGVAEVGEIVVWLAISVVASVFVKEKRLRITVLVVVVLAASELLSAALKPIYQRERPFQTLSGVIMAGGMDSGFSFPSGHALRTFASSLVLLRFRRVVGYLLIVVSVLVAFSRVYLGLHYPSDVLASFLLAYFLAGFIVLVGRAIASRKVQVPLQPGS